jgi:AcrR family transcriptional regulator
MANRAKRAGERLRQPTEIRRRLIVEAARTVIATRGLVGTSMRDIASASEVSLGTVTYHFTGLAEILTEVLQGEMDSFYQPILEVARAAEDATGAMNVVIDGFFGGDERTLQHWRLWLDFWGMSAHDEELAKWQIRSYEVWRSDMHAILSRGAIVDLDCVLVEFMALFDGLASQAYLPGSPVGPTQARKVLHGYVQRQLRTEKSQ